MMVDMLVNFYEFMQIPVFTGLFIALVATVLSLIIVLMDRVVNNYGEVEIVVNGHKKFLVKGGSTILNTFAEQEIFIPSACGGKATCGTCKVQVTSDIGQFLPTELPLLDAQEKKGQCAPCLSS